MNRMIVFAVFGTQVLTALAQMMATNEPTPGTREYYSKHIEGRYRYEKEKMVPAALPLGAPIVPGVYRSTAVQIALIATVVQVAGTNEVIVRTSQKMPSGADKQGYAVLQLGNVNGISVGQEIVTNVVRNFSYRCFLDSGMTNTLAGFRVQENPRTITYDEYLEVFNRDSQVEPIGEVVRLERFDSSPPVPKSLNLLRKRWEGDAKKQMSSAKGPSVPIPWTPERDAQPGKEGVFPPTENSQQSKANHAPEAIGASAPQPQR